MDPPENWALTSRLAALLKVIGTDTDRSGTSEFPLTFNSNQRPILYLFKILRNIGRKLRIFQFYFRLLGFGIM